MPTSSPQTQFLLVHKTLTRLSHMAEPGVASCRLETALVRLGPGGQVRRLNGVNVETLLSERRHQSGDVTDTLSQCSRQHLARGYGLRQGLFREHATGRRQ